MIKKYLHRVFIDGLSGMALGLFSTLIIGTIFTQIGTLVGGSIGQYIILVGKMAQAITGAGIGVGVAAKFQSKPLVTVSAAVAGMVGAYGSKMIGSALMVKGVFTLTGVGEPLGAFVAAYVAIEIGSLVAGKTKLDIVLTPLVAISSGSIVGILLGPPISQAMKWLGNLVNVNVEASPIIGGIIVSVLMGMILTLPISSAAIGLSMGLTGLAAGAATIGCCCQMVGFAVASYRENKFGGLVAQGIGTSMLQVPNIIQHPLIWIPSILSSAILAPIATSVLHMVSTPVGSGMGSAGFVGQIAAYGAMTAAGTTSTIALIEIVVMHFVLPALITLGISEAMRKLNLIKNGDMQLNV